MVSIALSLGINEEDLEFRAVSSENKHAADSSPNQIEKRACKRGRFTRNTISDTTDLKFECGPTNGRFAEVNNVLGMLFISQEES